MWFSAHNASAAQMNESTNAAGQINEITNWTATFYCDHALTVQHLPNGISYEMCTHETLSGPGISWTTNNKSSSGFRVLIDNKLDEDETLLATDMTYEQFSVALRDAGYTVQRVTRSANLHNLNARR